MSTRTLLTRSLRRIQPTRPSPSATRPFATEPDLPPLRENHGSSSHPRDSLRFADDSSASNDPEHSSTTPLTPTEETPLPSTDFELVAPEPLFPPLSSHPSPVPTVPFSTHRFVRRLEENHVPRELATELMKATRQLLLREEERARAELLGRADLENEAYLYTAALAELKTGSQVKSRNDGVALKSMTAVLQREADAISQKLNEDVQRLHSDIQLDMNQRKEETSQELKQLDINIMDLNSKFTILLGEVRTEIEATKWISTRRVMTAIVAVVVCVVAYVSAAPSKPKDPPPPPPSIEELGVRRGSEEAEVAPPGGWGFWSATPATAATGQPQKRVGSEEEGEEGK